MVMDVDVHSQLNAVRGENPTLFYSHYHAILDEDIILRVRPKVEVGALWKSFARDSFFRSKPSTQ